MIDINFVINGLEDAIDVIRKSEITGGKKARLIDACCNAVTLLEEQSEIIRCKDCKNSGIDSSGINDYWCSAHTEWHDANWFCADGKTE